MRLDPACSIALTPLTTSSLQVGPPPARPGERESSESQVSLESAIGSGTGEKDDRSLAPLTASGAYAAVVHGQRSPNAAPLEGLEWWQQLAVEHGCRHEPKALRVYNRLAFGRLRDMGKHGGWYRHRRNVGATPDGVTDDGVIVEVKCPYYRSVHHGYIPLRYWWQVQCQLEATGLDEADYMEYDTRTGATNLVRVHRSPKAGGILQHAGSIARVERCL